MAYVSMISDFYDMVLVFAYYLSNIVCYNSQCDITLVLKDIISFVHSFLCCLMVSLDILSICFDKHERNRSVQRSLIGCMQISSLSNILTSFYGSQNCSQ